jgi:dTDP-4-dehydrorhamnose 3,5-epimerase
MEEPRIIDGGIAVDDRGMLSFANQFDFAGVKRFYQVRNFSPAVIRAFHGHRNEAKYAYVPSGAAIVATVPLDDLVDKKPNPAVKRFVLSAAKPAILYIPKNFANGFRCLQNETTILFFSTSSIDESKGDDIRFPYDVCGESIWETENR